jgi:hypothetical protein
MRSKRDVRLRAYSVLANAWPNIVVCRRLSAYWLKVAFETGITGCETPLQPQKVVTHWLAGVLENDVA